MCCHIVLFSIFILSHLTIILSMIVDVLTLCLASDVSGEGPGFAGVKEGEHGTN